MVKAVGGGQRFNRNVREGTSLNSDAKGFWDTEGFTGLINQMAVMRIRKTNPILTQLEKTLEQDRLLPIMNLTSTQRTRAMITI